MDSRWIQEALTQIGVDYKTDFPLSHASSFRIGGHAAIAAFPDSSESMCRVLDLLGHTRSKYTVMGRGSNVLFADDFYDGVLVFTSHLKQIVYFKSKLYYNQYIPYRMRRLQDGCRNCHLKYNDVF